MSRLTVWWVWCAAVLAELGASMSASQFAFDPHHTIGWSPRDGWITATDLDHDWTPGGWVSGRAPGRRAYFDLHIPKTAGCSFSIDVKRVLPDGEGYFSTETCYYTGTPMVDGDVKVVFLRAPTEHVYSQFLECKYDGWGISVVPSSDKPIMNSVTTWLRHFKGGQETQDLNCYHPYNMQVRALTCKGAGCHHYAAKPPLALALRNMESLFFVGIVEHYQASVCLFFAKTHAGRPLPDFCDCRDQAAWGSFPSAHETHSVPLHSVSDLTMEDRAMISELTKLDAQLYDAATERFAREVAEVEARTGTQILC